MGDRNGFLGEMKRRHVWRVAIAYAVGSWLIVQIATQLFPFFHVPGWAVRLVVLLLVIGFPVAVIWAWVFELTPEGIRRTAPVGSMEARPEHEDRSVARKLNVIIVVVLVLAIAMLAWRLYAVKHASPSVAAATPVANAEAAVHPGATPTAPIPAKSIAVLPFENLSSDKQNDYFVAGMQDLILTKLADVGDLKVISRTSTMQYGSHPQNLKTVGDQLGVATILEGSVQKQGDQVLINVQLIDAATDSHIWAQTYTRTLDNVFGVEGEVAAKIATALNAKLSPAQSAQLATAPTHNKAAYDAFLRAEYNADHGYLNHSTMGLKAAIPLYRQAVAKDPTFALAWARLSRVESVLANFGGGGEDVAQLNRQARADAGRALKLQPDLPAAQLALGYCDYYGRHDYAGALKAFAAVLVGRPNDADALTAQGYVQRRMGRFNAAVASLARAVALDPRNAIPTQDLGFTYMMTSRYAEAETWIQRALALEPDAINAKVEYSFAILYGSGNIPRALSVVQGDAPALKSQRALLLSYQRKFPAAIALEQSIPDTPDNFSVNGSKALVLAGYYWQAGDKARARRYFAQSLPQDRAPTAKLRGFNLASAWDSVGWDLIGIGRVKEGLAAIAKSEAILDQSHDALQVPAQRLYDAMAYAMAGRADLAVPLLAKTLAAPGIGLYYSPVLLWLDPVWDPIRHDPRFQALLKKYAKDKPAVIYPALSGTAAR